MTTATTSEQQKGRRGGVVQENELFISDIIETEDENHQPITVRVTIAPSPCPFRYAQGRVDADIKIYDSRKRLFRNKLGINTYVDIRNKIDERGANPFSIHYGDNDGELAVWLFGGGMGDMTDCAQVECDDFNHRDRCYQHLGLCEYPLNILEKMHQRVARMISDLKSPTSGQSLYPHVVVRPLKKEEVSKEMTAVARLVWITPNAEALIAQIARVSTSTTAVGTAATPDYERLLKYLISHQHWSPFEHLHIIFIREIVIYV
jgi:predicted pyridoxine 5'-phosphate oxidase superfamily flavin-nucleotide-binding protein